MIKPKLKRGTKLTIKDTGVPIVVERDRQDGTLFVFDENKPIGEQYYDVAIDNTTKVRKGRTRLKNAPKVLSQKEKTEKQILNDFYKEIALTMSFLCDECGAALHAFNQFARRSCCAHILSKADFPGIATNKANIIFLGSGFLGGCRCHDAFDTQGAEHRSKMKVYKLCLERFESLKEFLTDKEINKAKTYLNISYQ